jgi:Pyruvate/2-oxoacid:ferredoxin oxidoreductase delta subunit
MGAISFVRSVKGFFTGRGSITDFGERYPILDARGMSSIVGLYVAGNVAGTPDIRAALNSGNDVGRLLGRGDGRPSCGCEVDHDLVVVGAGPSGRASAEAQKRSHNSFVVLERKKKLSTIRAFARGLVLYDATTGDPANRSGFAYEDTTAGGLLESWEAHISALELPLRESAEVKHVTRRCHFEIEMGDGTTIEAHRVVLAPGKLIFLEKIAPGDVGIDCRLGEHSVSKPDEPGTAVPEGLLQRIGLRLEGALGGRRAAFLTAWALGIFAMYWWLYYGPQVRVEPGVWRHRIPFTSLALPGWSLYAFTYTAAVWGFGIRAILRWKDRLQTKRYATLIASQTLLFWALPELFFRRLELVSPAGGQELAYIWPLAVKPEYTAAWLDGGGWAHYMLAWNLLLSFALIPILAVKHGKKYCSWVCGCGGLAETLGDPWRQLSPKGAKNIARERAGYWVTGLAIVATVAAAANWLFPKAGALPGLSGFLTGAYQTLVDVWLIALVPVMLYPFLGGKTWCRFWCPAALYMQLFSAWVTRFRNRAAEAREGPKHTTYGIFSRKERCIACNMCSRYCEVGIDVRRLALKGLVLDNAGTSCIGCGICISVCPTRTLSFDRSFAPPQATASTRS